MRLPAATAALQLLLAGACEHSTLMSSLLRAAVFLKLTSLAVSRMMQIRHKYTHAVRVNLQVDSEATHNNCIIKKYKTRGRAHV